MKRIMSVSMECVYTRSQLNIFSSDSKDYHVTIK